MASFEDLTGQKFGKITVINRAEDYITSTNKVRIKWNCKCECGKEFVSSPSPLLNGTLTSCGCTEEKIIKRKKTQEEVNDFMTLCDYVRYEVLKYDKPLTKTTILRLEGLSQGKFYSNSPIDRKKRCYSYNEILLTFKFCKLDIDRALSKHEFKNESHKINYIMRIIEENINDVCIRLENTKKAEEKLKTIDIPIKTTTRASYKKISKENTNKRLDGLW